MDRAELADFLRRRRAALSPAEVGLPETGRRRTPGLRREEVASLAHMSVDFYERLEQQRGAHPSEQTIAALARALRLTPDQRSHLYSLAGFSPPPRLYRSDHPSPALLRVLAGIESPAQIVTDLGVTTAQNAAARALVGDQTRHRGLARSIIYRWFTDPAQRAIHPVADHPSHAAGHVSGLRKVHGRAGEDPEAAEMLAALLQESAEFRELWERHEVSSRSGSIKRFLHPLVGELTLHCDVVTGETLTENLLVFSATPGSEAAEKLALLGVVGNQSFAEDLSSLGREHP